MAYYIADAIIAYLLGSIMFSVIFTKKFKGFDVREKGSGNAGSTNVLRSAGPKVAILTLVCDVLKGVVAVAIALLIGTIAKLPEDQKLKLLEVAGIFVVLGHTYPIFFKFKGGKGVATSLGVLLIMNWKIGLICLISAVLVMLIFKIVSLGSMVGAILFPVLSMFLKDSFLVPVTGISYLIFAIILAAIVIFNHRSNINRIAHGTENKLSFSKSK